MNNITTIHSERCCEYEKERRCEKKFPYEGKSDFWFLGYVTGCAFAWLMFVVGCITTMLYVWGQIARTMK